MFMFARAFDMARKLFPKTGYVNTDFVFRSYIDVLSSGFSVKTLMYLNNLKHRNFGVKGAQISELAP